jgi:hypothetical protein
MSKITQDQVLSYLAEGDLTSELERSRLKAGAYARFSLKDLSTFANNLLNKQMAALKLADAQAFANARNQMQQTLNVKQCVTDIFSKIHERHKISIKLTAEQRAEAEGYVQQMADAGFRFGPHTANNIAYRRDAMYHDYPGFKELRKFIDSL